MILLTSVLDQFFNNTHVLKRLDPVTDQSLYNLILNLGIKSQELLIVLEELLMNAQEHGAGLAQFYFDHWEGHFLFLMTDCGPGIHRTIPLNPRLSDTKNKGSPSILRLSVEEGISGTGLLGRGMGLFYFSEFVRDHSAEALIASDKGCILQSGEHFSEKKTNYDLNATVQILCVAEGQVGL